MCDIIFQSIFTTNLSIMMNGSPCGFFKPTKGFRHVDPLSLYLFLFCMEAVPWTISHAENIGIIHSHIITKNAPPIVITKNAPPIRKLLFADDCLILCEASTQASIDLLFWRETSGQLIKLSKSEAFFTPKLTLALQHKYKISWMLKQSLLMIGT